MEYEGEPVVFNSDAINQLPAFNPLLSTQVDLFTFLLEKNGQCRLIHLDLSSGRTVFCTLYIDIEHI